MRELRRPSARAFVALAAIIAWACLFRVPAAEAQTPAEAAQPPLVVTLLTSRRTDLCYDSGELAAVTALAEREQARLNRLGGVGGRRVQIKILDDGADEARTKANVAAALADRDGIAIVGLTNSNRAKAAFDASRTELRETGMPFLSNISVNAIFKDFPNVFTTQASQDDERLPVMAEFIRRMQFESLAYLGLSDAVFSRALGDGLKRQLGNVSGMADLRIHGDGDGLAAGELREAVAALKEKQPALVVLGMGGKRAGSAAAAMIAAGVTPPLFLAGRIDALPAEIVATYPNAMYQLAWDSLPEADNNRMRQLVSRDKPETWVFEGTKIDTAPGWTSGECKPRPERTVADPMERANIRAIGAGARYADMVALVTEAARSAAPGTDVAGLRRHIVQQLTTAYAAGRGVFRGSFENWSFHAESRTAVRTPFVVILPQGLGRTQLAPIQFVRTRGGALRQIDSLYVDIDLVRAHRIDDNEKTFFAEFYLSMRSVNGATIDRLEFTNAFLDPKTNGRQLTVETLHDGGPSDAYPAGMKIYKVAGRFTYEPELASYPFDTQRFTIELQPKRADQPFVIQPPPLDLRDKDVATDGWDVKSQYVGYGEDFVPLLDAFTHASSVVPYYKVSFAWLMRRQTTDYYLRVVVPLAFIMVVAYLSYFISTGHFEAIVTIQVTALLSAVALYLSLPKLDSDSATLSDRIFVFNYMVVSLMIVISILRVNRSIAARAWMKHVLGLLHVVGVPVLIGAMALYVWRLTEL